MANLTDFLEPRLAKDVETSIRARADYKEWKELGELCNSFLWSGIFTGGANDNLSQPEKDIVTREENIMLGIWHDDKFLPAEMANSVLGEVRDDEIVPYQRKLEPLVRFSALPQTRLSHIRDAAEKLSFAIVPYEYINQNGIVEKYAEEGQWQYAQEIRKGFEEVDALNKAVDVFEKLDVYILCPVGFYDPWQEVKDEQTKQKIFGGELSQVAMILGMLMPTQKNLFQMSKTNAENIESLNQAMKSNFAEVRKTLDNIQDQISWLEDAVDVMKGEITRAAGVANAALNKATEVEYKLACLLDPLIFAVPRGTDLYDDDVNARLLMCFGADMPLDFFLRRGLVQVDSNGYYDPIVRIWN